MRRIKLNNKKTIVALSMAISVLLWYYVVGDINPSTTKQLMGMSVELAGKQDEKLVLTSDNDIKVDVRISGRRNDIYEIRRNDMKFTADLSNYDEGTHTVDIEIDTNIRGGTADIDYSPKQVEITLERVISKSFQAELVTSGNFPTGISEEVLELNDDEVYVTGIRSNVNTVSKVLANLNVSGIKNDQTVEVDLIAVDKRGNKVDGVELSKDKVNVKVLGANINTAKIQPTLVGELPEGYKISNVNTSPDKLKFIAVEGQVAVDIINTLEIDISSFTENTEVETEVVLPDGVELMEGSSKSVKVSFTVEQTSADQVEEESGERVLEYDFSEISLENIPDNLEISNLEEMPQVVTLRLSGEKQVLESVNKDDISLSVDFSEVSEIGEYTLSIDYTGVPDQVEVMGIGPESLECKMELQMD